MNLGWFGIVQGGTRQAKRSSIDGGGEPRRTAGKGHVDPVRIAEAQTRQRRSRQPALCMRVQMVDDFQVGGLWAGTHPGFQRSHGVNAVVHGRV